jgi:hypothetical protein
MGEAAAHQQNADDDQNDGSGAHDGFSPYVL